MSRTRLSMVCVLAAVAVLPGSGSAAATRAACTPAWHAVVQGRAAAGLTGVAALSPADVWTVGTTRTGLIAHWNGRSLRVVRTLRGSTPTGIAAVSRTNVWVVGYRGDAPLVMHWDGRRWATVPTPRLRSRAGLGGVTALSANDVWAAGQVGTQPLALHWDGTRLRAIVVGHEGAFYAIDGSSPHDVWAVGAQGLTAWTINDQDGLVMHWDGRRWQEVRGVYPDDEELGYEALDEYTGIDAVSRSAAWATHEASVRADVQRRRRGAWTVDDIRRLDTLEDVAAVGAADVWAVGSTKGPHPAILHWNGRAWRLARPGFATSKTTLADLSAISTRDVWAVGDGLVARYSC